MKMPARTTSTKQSAGLVLYRRREPIIEILLGHPGGPFWVRKDVGAWTIPKGSIMEGETPLVAARREFAEEIGYSPFGEFIPLGDAKQPGGKLVHVWAIEGDWDVQQLRSNMFEMEWPLRSGRRQTFPEIDRAEWFSTEDARRQILKGQVVFIERLMNALGVSNRG
jgi:predicted NUDIX family NTP pyrophosphohydrolase